MPTTIGILHSTGLTSAQTRRIKAGLATAGWSQGRYTWLPPTVKNHGKYGKKADNTNDTSLATAAAQLRTAGADIIIAAGGLVSALAAYDEAVKNPPLKVVGLIGRMPMENDTDRIPYDKLTNEDIVKGLANLNTPADNVTRRDDLAEQLLSTADSKRIALLVNTNSSMWAEEERKWLADTRGTDGRSNPVLKFPRDAGRHNNDHAHFQQFFNNHLGGAVGIVVSSDPFFYWFRGRMMQKCPVPICFPFAEYGLEEATNKQHDEWDTDKHIVSPAGLSLLDKYQELGQRAGEALGPPPK